MRERWGRSSNPAYCHTSTHLANHCMKGPWLSDCRYRKVCERCSWRGFQVLFNDPTSTSFEEHWFLYAVIGQVCGDQKESNATPWISRRRERYKHFGPYWNITTATGWIIQFSAEVHGPLKMNPTDFDDSQLSLWHCQQLYLFTYSVKHLKIYLMEWNNFFCPDSSWSPNDVSC